MANLAPGAVVAYSAKFLKSTGQFTGPAGARRGVYIGPDARTPGYARVHWDNEPAMIESRSGQFAEADYCEDVRLNGSLVFAGNIAAVGSARFALNDL